MAVQALELVRTCLGRLLLSLADHHTLESLLFVLLPTCRCFGQQSKLVFPASSISGWVAGVKMTISNLTDRGSDVCTSFIRPLPPPL